MGALKEEKREAFAQALVRGRNQRQAYREAFQPGPEVTDAQVDMRACRLMKNAKVRERVEELRAKVERKLAKTQEKQAERTVEQAASAAEMVREEVLRIAFGSKAYPRVDQHGETIESPPTVSQRLKALELAGKMYGLFTDKVEHSGQAQVQVRGPELGLEEKLELIQRAAREYAGDQEKGER